MTRRSTGIASLLVTLAVLLATGSTAATAGTRSSVTGTGSITCSKVTGSIAFRPPIVNNGSTPETATVTVATTGCTTSGSNIKTVTKGVGHAIIRTSTNSCSNLLMSLPVAVSLVWTSKPAAAPTKVAFSGYTPTLEPGSYEAGFSLPNSPNGTTTVTGSFAGKDRGASSSAAAYTNMTMLAIGTACGTSAGLSSLKIDAGTAALK